MPSTTTALITNYDGSGQVIMVVSGEAIKLGDARNDSAKSPTSLRIRAGQLYGAEEVRACSWQGGRG